MASNQISRIVNARGGGSRPAPFAPLAPGAGKAGAPAVSRTSTGPAQSTRRGVPKGNQPGSVLDSKA